MFIATLIVKLQPPQLRAFPASPATPTPSAARSRKPRFPAAAYHVPAHRLGVGLTVSCRFSSLLRMVARLWVFHYAGQSPGWAGLPVWKGIGSSIVKIDQGQC